MLYNDETNLESVQKGLSGNTYIVHFASNLISPASKLVLYIGGFGDFGSFRCGCIPPH